MLIIKTEEDRERCTSCYGNRTIELTMEEVVALFAGATLGDPNFNEYGVDLLVYFGKYCKSCKHEKLEENEPPCDECLEHPVNLNSHKPINYEDKSD